jgi:site-specific recombinase XerD
MLISDMKAPSLARRPSQTGSLGPPQGPSLSSDIPLAAFLAFLAEDTRVGERTARLYVGRLRRLAGWLEQRYQAALLEATTRDLRQYKNEFGEHQTPASVNAAMAALRRFYAWADDTERIAATPLST